MTRQVQSDDGEKDLNYRQVVKSDIGSKVSMKKAWSDPWTMRMFTGRTEAGLFLGKDESGTTEEYNFAIVFKETK
jgi:hypothetical protein